MFLAFALYFLFGVLFLVGQRTQSLSFFRIEEQDWVQTHLAVMLKDMIEFTCF